MDPTLAMAEIEALHDFFVDWFRGLCPDDDETFSARFTDRFESSFSMIPPAGTAKTFAELADDIRAGHGKNPDFGIRIRNLQQVSVSRGFGVFTYEEWQRGAKNTEPPENVRVSTVIFRADETTPGGLRWVHLHETACAPLHGDFDF